MINNNCHLGTWKYHCTNFLQMKNILHFVGGKLSLKINISWASFVLCDTRHYGIGHIFLHHVYITAYSTSFFAEAVNGDIPAWPLNITAAILLFPAGTILTVHGNILAL